MRRLIGAVAVAAFAAVLTTGVAFADDGGGSSNSNSQTAVLVQTGTSDATAVNVGGNEAEAKSISSNDATVDQSSAQIAKQGSNSNSQAVTSVQGADSSATAVNVGQSANEAEATAKADNDLYVGQYVKQLAFGYCGECGDASNTNTQDVVGVQLAGAQALAKNLWGNEAEAFAGTFNDAWVTSCIFQLAWSGYIA